MNRLWTVLYDKAPGLLTAKTHPACIYCCLYSNRIVKCSEFLRKLHLYSRRSISKLSQHILRFQITLRPTRHCPYYSRYVTSRTTVIALLLIYYTDNGVSVKWFPSASCNQFCSTARARIISNNGFQMFSQEFYSIFNKYIYTLYTAFSINCLLHMLVCVRRCTR